MVNPKVQAMKAHEASRRLKGIDPLSTQPVELPLSDLSEEEIREVLEDNFAVIIFSKFGIMRSGVVEKADEARLVRIMLEMATERAREVENKIIPSSSMPMPNTDDIRSWKDRIKS